MLTIHNLSTSHSHVVPWLAEELGLAYDLVLHEREPIGRARESPPCGARWEDEGSRDICGG